MLNKTACVELVRVTGKVNIFSWIIVLRACRTASRRHIPRIRWTRSSFSQASVNFTQRFLAKLLDWLLSKFSKEPSAPLPPPRCNFLQRAKVALLPPLLLYGSDEHGRGFCLPRAAIFHQGNKPGRGFGRAGVPKRKFGRVMQFPGSHCFFGSKVISIVRRGGAGELLFRSKVISIVRRGVRVNCFSGQRSLLNCPARGCGWIAFQVKGHFTARGVRVNCFFGSKVIAHCSGEGVRVNCFQVKGQKVAGKCWIVLS